MGIKMCVYGEKMCVYGEADATESGDGVFAVTNVANPVLKMCVYGE